MRKIAAITGIVVGIVMAVAGVATWVVISTTLATRRSPSPTTPTVPPATT